MDSERTPDEAADDRPVSTRPAPGPRSGDPRPANPRPANPRRADPGTLDLSRIDPAPTNAGPAGVVPAGAVPADPGLTGGYLLGGPPSAAAAEPTVPTNIYRARRPAVAVLLIIPAVIAGLLLIRALAISAFGTPFLIGGVIASGLSLAALPLLVSGLYGLVTGAAHGAEQWGFRVWARPPLAYLVVGIAFAVAAGLAIS